MYSDAHTKYGTFIQVQIYSKSSTHNRGAGFKYVKAQIICQGENSRDPNMDAMFFVLLQITQDHTTPLSYFFSNIRGTVLVRLVTGKV